MSEKPQEKIGALPLDVFGGEQEPAPEPAAEAAGAVSEAAAGAETASPAPETAQANLRSWAEAGFEAGDDPATGIPRRTRRVYDLLLVLALWVLFGLAFNGITIHARMFPFLLFAAGASFAFSRLNGGASYRRLHLFLDRQRKRLGA